MRDTSPRLDPLMPATGAWTAWYERLGRTEPLAYGEPLTYRLAANFLADCALVEDWGCGLGFMRTLIAPERYRGIDGSASRFADELVDLETYRSDVAGVFLRHVLEHNHGWERILRGAVASCRRKLALVIFTPFAETTRVLAEGENVRVPDIAFAKADLARHFAGLAWRDETYPTATQYGTETIFYVSKPCLS